MAIMYSVTVLAFPSDRVVRLQYEQEHPDARAAKANKSMVLMSLREPANRGDALAQEVDFAVLTDRAWQQRYASGFVSQVKRSARKSVTLEVHVLIPPGAVISGSVSAGTP